MQRRNKGQSLVEMALLMPLMLLVLFGIIDLGYYMYGYATIYQSARNGSEAAQKMPPFPSRLTKVGSGGAADACIQTIRDRAQAPALFPDLKISITYPEGSARQVGSPIEVTVEQQLEPLTPIFRSFGENGRFTVRATSRRTIESLSESPNNANFIACQP